MPACGNPIPGSELDNKEHGDKKKAKAFAKSAASQHACHLSFSELTSIAHALSIDKTPAHQVIICDEFQFLIRFTRPDSIFCGIMLNSQSIFSSILQLPLVRLVDS